VCWPSSSTSTLLGGENARSLAVVVPAPWASDDVVRIGLGMSAVAVLALLAALVLGWPRLLPASLVVLGAVYALYLFVDDVALDSLAALFAAGLLVTAELGYWSLEEREDVQVDPGEQPRRLALVAGLGLAALVTSAALLAIADAVEAGGLGVDLLGAAAAAAVLLLVVLFARSSAERRASSREHGSHRGDAGRGGGGAGACR
jgi:hypothetical protein